MSIQSVIENELVEDAFSVWRLKGHREFGYSDGAESEKYLERVFRQAEDLSTRSAELETYIKDWPSKYHLTTKRAQLLSGFNFDRSLKALEVGCGCGAITRHLGENFNQVISVEGNINRARLARQRTRDLDSVSVVCAPFQELRFSQKFDIIFCIGVFEYSASFIEGEDPYDAALRYFSNILTPDGIVVIAIENQFGLKYFNGSREDHLGVRFEGLEGYHHKPGKVRTFGKVELEKRLKKYFPAVQFYYPYPDYKLPDSVISSEFLASEKAGELVSQMRSEDHGGPMRALWDESAVSLELARNGTLEFFANSFLVLAGRRALERVTFEQLAVIFSSKRKPIFSTKTRILKEHNEQISVSKYNTQGKAYVAEGLLKLVDTKTLWVDTLSLQSQLFSRACQSELSLAEIFAPCRKFIELLISESSLQEGVRYVEGAHIDSIWSNAYIVGNTCKIVDKEWVWGHQIRVNVIIIRSVYNFLSKIDAVSLHTRALLGRSGKTLICDIASAFGVALVKQDFVEFIRLESEFQECVFGINKLRHAIYLRWFLMDRPTVRSFRRIKFFLCGFYTRLRTRFFAFSR